MQRTTSSVTWKTKSFFWDIRNFSEICGLTTSPEKNDDESDMDSGDVQSGEEEEYNCLLDIDFLQSPVIEIGDKCDGTDGLWIIKLTKSVGDPNSIDVQLELTQMGHETDEDFASESYECLFKYKIAVMGSNGLPVFEKENGTIALLKSGNSWYERGILKLAFLREHKDKVLNEDTLKLKINISVLNDLHHSNVEPFELHETEEHSSPTLNKKRKMDSDGRGLDKQHLQQADLAKQILSSLWKTRANNGDAVLQCGASTFNVHKSVLSGASPVFCAAFTHDMSENAENRIVIRDMNPETLELLLRFIYCDHVLDEPGWTNIDVLNDLLNASEKYQILTLKSVCFTNLLHVLTLNNAAQIVVLVDMYEPDEFIRNSVYKYVLSNIAVLKKMESFKKKMREIPAAFTPLLLMLGE